jgi:hypothetical protein
MNYPAPTRGAVHTGQATQIEQSRVIAEVEAAVLMAHRFPRDMPDVRRRLTEVCKDPYLANRAFYVQRRTGGEVTGLTVHLARAMAVGYRNMQANVVELERDLARRQSQMMAYAWDLENNVRVSTTWIVEHRRDVQKSIVDIENLSGIYENNANQSARRLREQIVALLPPSLVKMCVDTCRATVKDGGGVPMSQRVAKILELFEELSVTRGMLERRLRRAAGEWIPRDIAELQVVFESLTDGSIHIDEAFPPDEPEQAAPPAQLGRVQRPAPAATPTPRAPAEQPEPEPEPEPEPSAARRALDEHVDEVAEAHRAAVTPPEQTVERPTEQPITRRQSDKLFACFRDLGLDGRSDEVRVRRLQILSALVEDNIGSQNDLTSSQAEMCATALRGWAARPRKEQTEVINDLLAGWEARHRAPEPAEPDDDGVPAEPTDDDGGDS